MESKAKDYCIRAAIALLLVIFTGISAWAQDPASIGSIQYNSTLGAYEINSVQNLNDLAVYVNGTGTYSDNTTTETTAHSCEGLTFKQTANITYTGTNNYTPIGLYVNDDGFQGTFDGQGNTISGIYCTGDGVTGGAEERLGLFGWNQGTVRNVTLSGCRFASANNENYSNNYAIYVRSGSIAGENDETGTITGCTVTGGTVRRTRTADAETFETLIGGIAGENYGNITGCTYSGSVSCTYSGSNINRRFVINIGGIAGISKNGGSITGCGSDAAVSCSAPNISAPSLFVGGIAGLNNGSNRDATVSDCFFSGTLSGTGKTGGSTSYIYIGAFVGRSINSSIVTNNYYYGDYASPIGYEDGKVTLANLVRVYQLTGNGITATAPQGSGTTFKGVSYFKADATVTLAPQTGYAITSANYNDGSENHEITPDNGVWSFQMPSSDVTVSLALTVLPWSGDGSEGNPYLIEYASQLDLLAHRVNGTHGETRQEDGYYNTYFQLANDISYTHNSDWNAFDNDESNYEAIGGYYDGDTRYFRGHFDGNNKTISGIRIYRGGNSNANNYQGIFGGTDSGADIHDLTLADARITGYNSTGGIVGYVGYNRGTVTRCHVADDVAVCAVQSHAYYHGGIVGRNRSGTIEQCTSAATLTIADADNSDYYGGIAGSNSGTLRDNLAIGATVPAAADNTYGAITGYNDIVPLQRNYYAACKVANVENATGVGCGYIDDGNGGRIVADVTADNGAVCINTLALAANQAPDGNYWTTYYNSALGFTIDADENACAYTAEYDNTDPNAPQLTLHKLGKVIPKGTAVILVGADNSISMTASDETATVPTNNLQGYDVRTSVADIKTTLGDGTLYVMGKVNDVFGFYQYTAQYMPAHKAFLLVNDGKTLTKELRMVVEDDADGIDSLTPTLSKGEGAIYNLAGQRVSQKALTQRGSGEGARIYIVNGKKILK